MKKPIQQVQGKRVYSGVKVVRKLSQSDYFDDCYVCQMTKKAEEEGKSLSVKELREIFEKANTQN